MRTLNVLNLYAGLGGNRRKWTDCAVTAVELDHTIACAYAENFPDDRLIVADAHDFLLHNYQKFDIIWSSPPCQSHSRFIRSGRNRKPTYPDMSLYEEILFLKHNFKGSYVVENVVPYYEPFLNPTKLGRHLFWTNFKVSDIDVPTLPGFISKQNAQAVAELKSWLGIDYDGSIYYNGNHDPSQVLRNCVHPDVGLSVFKDACAVLTKQEDIL